MDRGSTTLDRTVCAKNGEGRASCSRCTVDEFVSSHKGGLVISAPLNKGDGSPKYDSCDGLISGGTNDVQFGAWMWMFHEGWRTQPGGGQ